MAKRHLVPRRVASAAAGAGFAAALVFTGHGSTQVTAEQRIYPAEDFTVVEVASTPPRPRSAMVAPQPEIALGADEQQPVPLPIPIPMPTAKATSHQKPQVKPKAPPRPTAIAPRTFHSLTGKASWYCKAGVSVCHYAYPPGSMVAAACTPLRAALPNWRGRIVVVTRRDTGVRVVVKLVDYCASTDKTIDLYWEPMRRLGGSGVLPVTVRW
jgi:hypothetical protein